MRLGLAEFARPLVPHLAAVRRGACGRGGDELLARLLTAVNARLRAQATAARPRLRELRWALTQGEREVTNYTRAIGRGDFASLATALRAAEQCRAALQAERAQLDGHQQPAVLQRMPAALKRHLQGIPEKLRSGVTGKVREAIQQSIARILGGTEGSMTIEAGTGGLLGLAAHRGQVGEREDPTLLAPTTLSTASVAQSSRVVGQPCPST